MRKLFVAALASVLMACGGNPFVVTTPTPEAPPASPSANVYYCWKKGTTLRLVNGPQPHLQQNNPAEELCTPTDLFDSGYRQDQSGTWHFQVTPSPR